MEPKEFHTLDVMGVYTGILFDSPEGFNGIHKVLDHLYPGIGTIGCMAVADSAMIEVKRQLAAAGISRNLPTELCTGDNYMDWGQKAIDAVGSKLTIFGPL